MPKTEKTPKPPKTEKLPKQVKPLKPRRRLLDPKVGKRRRKALARSLRGHITAEPLGVADMAERLDVDPEVIVVLLRELRTGKRGTLRTTLRLGHAAWYWEDPPEQTAALAGETIGG